MERLLQLRSPRKIHPFYRQLGGYSLLPKIPFFIVRHTSGLAPQSYFYNLLFARGAGTQNLHLPCLDLHVSSTVRHTHSTP